MRRKTVTTVLLVAALAFSFTSVASDQKADIVEAEEGMEWIKMGMILDIGNPGDPDSVNAAGGFVMIDDGIYKMWYNGLDGTYIRIMYAISSDGLTWTKHGVVVDLGNPGDFDDEYAKDASVLRNDHGTYEMWYTGQSASYWGWRILHATSNDGVNWQKQGLVFSVPGKSVAHPYVLLDENGVYKMWFSEYDNTHWRIRYATSSNGLTWTDRGIAIDVGPPGDPDSKYVYEPGVVIEPDGTYLMFYSVFDGNPSNIVDVHYAVSPDGIGGNWKKQGLSLGHGGKGDYDEIQVLRPIVTVRPDGSYMLWYTGKDTHNNARMMLAVEKPGEIEATVDCGPQTLNLKSMGNWMTCYIELPLGYDPRDIDAATILLNDMVRPELDPKYDFVTLEEDYITDHDADGVEERMVKFERSDVQDILDVGHVVVLTITGGMFDETRFAGTDTMRVIDPPKMVPLGPKADGFIIILRGHRFIDPLPPLTPI